MRLRPVAAIALLLALVGTSAAQQKLELVEFVSGEGKYKVQMPSGVKTEKKELPVGDKKLTMHTAAVAVGTKSAIVVTHLDFADPIAAGSQKEVVKKTAEGAAQKGKMLSDKEYAYGKDKLPGRDCLVETATHFMRYRNVLAGQRMYQLMVLGPKDFVTSKDADKVLDSFEVTK